MTLMQRLVGWHQQWQVTAIAAYKLSSHSDPNYFSCDKVVNSWYTVCTKVNICSEIIMIDGNMIFITINIIIRFVILIECHPQSFSTGHMTFQQYWARVLQCHLLTQSNTPPHQDCIAHSALAQNVLCMTLKEGRRNKHTCLLWIMITIIIFKPLH